MNEKPCKKSTAAFFDVDGTLWKGNIVRHYLDLVWREPRSISQQIKIAKVFFQLPYYLFVDRLSRSYFNRIFYQNYCQMSVSGCHYLSEEYFKEISRDRLFGAAIECIQKHKDRDRLVILVSGSPSFIVSPIANFLKVDLTIATNLEAVNGFYSGKIIGSPLAGEEKARWIELIARQREIDLNQSYAYGDSVADIPMLSTVGHPAVVNPSRALKRVAKEKGWPIEQWKIVRESQ